MAFPPLILLFILFPNREHLAEGDFFLMTARLKIVGVLQIFWAISFIALVRGITSRQADKQIYMSA